ncbi:putative uncharacterized protein [Firmicutes bacterium CAG:791]|nr:putative uncharacterized protein [Firmicutes bacterium CAG:791]
MQYGRARPHKGPALFYNNVVWMGIMKKNKPNNCIKASGTYPGMSPAKRKRLSPEKSCDLRRLSYLLIVIYALSLIPVLVIGKYDYPSADDFSMGLGTRLVYEATGSLLAVAGKILSETVRYYRTWIGYFTSCLFTTVSPATFGEAWYALTPAVILLALHVGVTVFFYALMEKALGMNRYARRCMTVLALFLMVQRMPEGSLRVEAFYWYSGAGNYTLTFSAGLLYLAFYVLSVCGVRSKNRSLFLVLACIMGFLAGGGNYLSALSFAVVSVLFAVYLVKMKIGRLLPAAFYLCGFAVSCLSPGNRIRGGEAEGYGALKSILLSLYYTLSYPLNQWMNWAVLLILALAGVIFWIGFAEIEFSGANAKAGGAAAPEKAGSGAQAVQLGFTAPFPAAVLAYGIVSCVVTPALYAQGNMDAGRIQSTFWLHAVLVLLLLEWYLVGGLYRRFSKEQNASAVSCPQNASAASCLRNGAGGFVRAILLFFIVFSLLAVKGNPDFYTGTSAVSELLDGSAAQYGRENEERLRILKNPREQDAVLPRYTVQPNLLYFEDVSEDPDDWINQKMSEYYGRNSIRGISG